MSSTDLRNICKPCCSISRKLPVVQSICFKVEITPGDTAARTVSTSDKSARLVTDTDHAGLVSWHCSHGCRLSGLVESGTCAGTM